MKSASFWLLVLTALVVAVLSGIGFASIAQTRQIQAQAYHVFVERCIAYVEDDRACNRPVPSIGAAIQILRCRDLHGLTFMECIAQEAHG